MPGAVISIGFEVTGFPLPYSPIWFNGDELQAGGWQIAVMAAAPGNVGVTVPDDATGIVVGVVDTNSSGTPVRIVPFLSVTMALIGCGLFGFTTTLLPVASGTLSAI